MTTDTIADVMGPERTIGCEVEIASMMFDPGVISRHTPRARSWFALGAIDKAADGRESEIAALLRHSGSVDVVTDIRATKWMKLVGNATALVPTALLGAALIRSGWEPANYPPYEPGGMILSPSPRRR